MSNIDVVASLLESLGLKYTRTKDNTAIILGYKGDIPIKVWIGFDSGGEWLGLRSPIDIKVPEETSARERLFRNLLEMNERLAIGKVVLSEGQLGAGVEIDSDFLNKDNLDLGLSAIQMIVRGVLKEMKGRKGEGTRASPGRTK